MPGRTARGSSSTCATRRSGADLAEQYVLGVYTHMYETRGQRVMANEDYGGSFLGHVEEAGPLNWRFNIAHSVWIRRDEMERMAAADADGMTRSANAES